MHANTIDQIQEAMTVAEVAQATRTSPITVRRWIAQGHRGKTLRATKIVGSFRIRAEDLEAFLNRAPATRKSPAATSSTFAGRRAITRCKALGLIAGEHTTPRTHARGTTG